MLRIHVKNYLFPIVLLSAILLGGFFGYRFEKEAVYLKPFGEIFLRFIFTAIVPLIFFSVSSAIVRAGILGNLEKIMRHMSLVFLVTGIVAAIYAILVVTIFPPAENILLQLPTSSRATPVSFVDQITNIFTVSDFPKLWSHNNMLPLITFSILVGLSISAVKENGDIFSAFLQSGEIIFMRFFSIIMYFAPIGFFAYFAVLVSELGPHLIGSYVRIALIYAVSALLYFIVFYSTYAWLAGKKEGLILFWKNILIPATTAIATCSGAASIPANLHAAKAMKIPQEIYETTIPLGSLIHKDGSIIGGIFKIVFLFGIFHMDFSGVIVLVTALGVSLLVGTIMGAIPSGGMLGELLILSVYGFPPSVLIAVAVISIIIDPFATLLNVTGNSVSSMMIARLVNGKQWLINE